MDYLLALFVSSECLYYSLLMSIDKKNAPLMQIQVHHKKLNDFLIGSTLN